MYKIVDVHNCAQFSETVLAREHYFLAEITQNLCLFPACPMQSRDAVKN
jgi:hypothetical protein